ncbi:MAG: mechanosensitive ion channel domain-containing protein [Planctomycetaceae bacterium]
MSHSFHRHHFAGLRFVVFSLFALMALPASVVFSQETQPKTDVPKAEAPPVDPAETITVADLEARIKQVEESTDLDADAKKKVVEHFRNAIAQLQRTELLHKQADELQAAVTDIPERVKTIRSDTEALHKEPEKPADAPLPELEQQLATKSLSLQELRSKQTQLETEPATRAARRKEIREKLMKISAEWEEVKQKLKAPSPENELPLLTQAQHADLLTRREMFEQESIAGQLELTRYDTEDAADWLTQKRDLLVSQIKKTQAEIDLLQTAVQVKRELETQEAVNKAQLEAIRALPLLRPYAEENQHLAEEAQSLNEKNLKIEADRQQARQRVDRLRQQFTQTKQKVDAVGLTGAIGLLLRKERNELPNVSLAENSIAERRQIIDDTEFARLEYTDQRNQLSDLDPKIEEILASAQANGDETARKRLANAARKVLESQRATLDLLLRHYKAYFTSLVELDTTEQELVKLATDYRMYIDERVLWIRSAKPLYADFELDQSDLKWLRYQSWMHIAQLLLADVMSAPVIYLSALLMFAALMHVGRQFRRDLADLAEIAERGSCIVFLPTFHGMILTLVISLPAPGLLFFLSWRLSALPEKDELVQGLSSGFFVIALVFALSELVRQMCRPRGLAEAHFDWPASVCADIRKTLPKLLSLILPLVLVIHALQTADPLHGQDVVERVAFMLGTVIIAAFVYRLLQPEGTMFREYRALYPEGWIDRLGSFWAWLGVGSLLIIAGLSFFGYHYTARQVAFKLSVSFELLVVLFLLRSAIFRAILIMGRRVSINESRRRAINAAQESQQSNVAGLTPHKIAPEMTQRFDVSTNIAQFKRIVLIVLLTCQLIGLWFIWSEVFPAIKQLDRWSIGSTSVTVTEQVVNEDGTTSTKPEERIELVTVVDLGMAILAAIVTFVAAHNIPGILEMALLQRLPLDNSIRYAITTLSRYIIVILGIIFGFNLIGLGWSQVQWLVTALTFGLAFGLQEIFANFVAGIILLFERPIRIGDIVSVEGVDGVVTRIRMRATTIANWDRKEYIVPNKDLITGRLMNWTLSDQINRVVINVGIAYGSDASTATELLLKTAKEHPLILTDPPPLATFEGFGDNSLNLVLRCFLPNLNNRLLATDELHKAIYKAFAEAGIEISFPQRDIHIRSLPPGFGEMPGKS